jgi:glutathione reductase (NADPH)
MMEKEDKAPTKYKIVCQGPQEKVVGLHILGLGSSEILQGFSVAIVSQSHSVELRTLY